MRRVLLLGGLDPSGGAGVTLDATVASLHGVAPLPIALSATVQGARGFVTAAPIAARTWREQVRTVVADGAPDAVKVGYVGSAAVVAELAEALRPLASRAPLVVDPVLSATAGGMPSDGALARAYLTGLVPLAALVTPNAPELDALGGGDPATLLRAGARAVLHKGGHGGGV
ncbi:MAG: bifunctional hydroxymethylpyrimidine kinase/phosphomethylpyrimidine kinase, partial [Planctomycetota bacterium]